ncbi:hypothetical protein [Phytoactinopolyspora limicola]|uniref:hypothetical protein n=1 Tax=Phytoactinopolyspora limicola TaxID=2715536 RepID=UPI00140B7E11|nr:hypothetical protein [Phytoactinopolyspora limicola]
MRVNDAHVHVWSESPPWPELLAGSLQDGRAVSLLAAMDAAGVDMAAVITPRSMAWDNSVTLQAAHAHPERLVAISRVRLTDSSSVRTLKEQIDDNVRGFRIDLAEQGDVLDGNARSAWGGRS